MYNSKVVHIPSGLSSRSLIMNTNVKHQGQTRVKWPSRVQLMQQLMQQTLEIKAIHVSIDDA